MKGHTLLELVISLLIMIIVIFGVIAIFPYSAKATKQSVNITNLMFLAQLKAEDLKSKRFDLYYTDPALSINVPHKGNFGSDLSDKDFSQYGYTYSIEDVLKSEKDQSIIFLKKAAIIAYGPGDIDNQETPMVSMDVFIRCYDTRRNAGGANNLIIGPQPFPLPAGAPTVYENKIDTTKKELKNLTNEEKKWTEFYPVLIFDKESGGCKKLLLNNSKI